MAPRLSHSDAGPVVAASRPHIAVGARSRQNQFSPRTMSPSPPAEHGPSHRTGSHGKAPPAFLAQVCRLSTMMRQLMVQQDISDFERVDAERKVTTSLTNVWPSLALCLLVCLFGPLILDTSIHTAGCCAAGAALRPVETARPGMCCCRPNQPWRC